MKRTLTSITLCLCILTASAQTTKVSGKVNDEEGRPVSDVIVSMFSADSTHLGTALTTPEGLFELQPAGKPYILHFDHLSYESQRKVCESYDVMEVVMTSKDNAIEAGVATAYRPIVKIENSALRYDLKQLASNTTASNVFEALAKLPGIQEKDGEFKLAGANSVTVIINGKPTRMDASQLETLLRSMPVERIKSVDVMYSAPPQYNVRGAAINLILDRSMDNSYSGEAAGTYSLQKKSSYKGSGSFMVSNPKWSADMIYSYSDHSGAQINDLISNHTVGTETTYIRQVQDIMALNRSHNIRAAFDWTPKSDRTLSFIYTGALTPYNKTSSVSKGIFVNSDSEISGPANMHNIAVRYQGPKGLDIGADYSSYHNETNTVLSNRFTDGTESSFTTYAGQKISRVNAFADMKHQFSQRWGISYGMKGSWANDNDYQYYEDILGDVTTSNTDGQLTEWNTSAYLGGSVNFSKGSLSASLTGDYYNLNGDVKWTLYPQANFSWMFNPNHIIQANFSSDKRYPSYWQLNNSVTYLDGYAEVHGNPYLKPMDIYNSQLIYIFRQRYVVALIYNQINNLSTQGAYQLPDRLALLYKQINFDFQRQYGISATIPVSVGNWMKSNLTVNCIRMEEKCDNYFDISFDRGKWVGMVSLNNNFQICRKPAISLDLDGMYMTGAIQGLYDMDAMWGVDAGIKFSFLEKKLNITAKVDDIFESRMPVLYQKTAGQDLVMDLGAFTRVFRLTLSYRFGGYTTKERKSVDTSRFGH